MQLIHCRKNLEVAGRVIFALKPATQSTLLCPIFLALPHFNALQECGFSGLVCLRIWIPCESLFESYPARLGSSKDSGEPAQCLLPNVQEVSDENIYQHLHS